MPENSSPNALCVVSFIAGGCRFAVEAAHVRTLLQAGQYDAATSVEQILGLPCDQKQDRLSPRILLMKCQGRDVAVIVSGPVEMHSLEIGAIYPLPPLIAARSTVRGIRALAIQSGGVTVLVDFQEWLNHSLVAEKK